MRRRTLAIATTAVATAVTTGVISAGSGGAAGAGPQSATIITATPASFDHPAANPYFPITPGLVFRLKGSDGKAKFSERVTVTHRTKLIQGVHTKVLRDVLRRADGSVAEATDDWYADDTHGNVWYFGEATATYTRGGKVSSREGSWQAGVRGGVAGIIMPAHPRPTDAYRQELRHGVAEDQAWIVQREVTARQGSLTYHHVVRTFEWSRLEPANISEKFYARGVGMISEHDVAGGREKFHLVSVSHT